jgi:hypothetical protein
VFFKGAKAMTYTNQKQIRAAFWDAHPEANRRKITDHAGTGKMHTTDTRCAFVDFVDHLSRSGRISEALANRATL